MTALLLGFLLKALGHRAGMAIVLLFFSLGILRTQSAMRIPQLLPGTYSISATVSGGARLRSDNRLTFVLDDVLLDGEPFSGKGYCSLHYEELPPELFDGARIHFTARVYLPDGKSGEPHMDFRMWMLQQGLSFGVAAYQEVLIENTPQTAPISDPWYRMREAFGRSLERVMGDHARMAMALLLGDRSGINETETKAFQELGIAHVMSVSGLHVSILGGMICWLMDHLRMNRRSQLLVMAVFLSIYCAITGFSAASIRAAIMLLSYSSARILMRYPDRLTVLAGAMLGVLVLQPLQAFSAGFMLSFSAMLGITLYSHAVQELLMRLFAIPEHQPREREKQLLRRIQIGLLDTFTVSFCAQLGVLLPSMVFFHQLPLYGIFINMMIVPLVSFVLMPLYTAVLPLSLIPGIGALAGHLASLATELLLWLVALLSRLPCAAVRVGSPSLLICIGVGLVLITLSRRMPGSLRRRIAASLMIAAVTLVSSWIDRPAEVRYIQLSVGQADSALMMDGRTTILLDCGADGEAALDYLMDENRDIDALIITHLHLDHIGGVQQLLDSPVKIHQVYLPLNAEYQRADEDALLLLEQIRSAGIPVAELASGDELRYNKIALRVLWPEREHGRTGHPANEMPLVTAIDFDGYTIFTSSDLEGLYENYAAVPADVLKVAHHGSSSSTSTDYLHFVSPEIALISSSSGSKYLPGEETLQRLKDAGIRVLRTDECGDITLSVRNGALTVTPYKAR
ncbi:MAG: DNA internalization-related competence protein ComEC/Rec2 [Clostridia bacterium]|nr:DNA internalization-related competence protein ComEC/Rec2 [Clostridia bacterium]